MEFYESTSLNIGYKIPFVSIIDEISEINFELINEILFNSCVEDENDTINESYLFFIESQFIYKAEYKRNEISFSEYKQKCNECMYSNNLEKYFLLVPMNNVLITCRWGYNRKGINASSIPIEDAMYKITSAYDDKYNFLFKYPKILYIDQTSG